MEGNSRVVTIGDAEFVRLRNYINANYGIKLPDVKKTMLQARLQKRLKANNLKSFEEYCELVFSDEGEQSEIVHMIDMVSTNKTDFFREPNHFDFMKTVILPEFQDTGRSTMKIWSSACSSGEEVYTIAMVLSEFLRNRPSFDYHILGTDISLQMLEKSARAIYPMSRIADLSMDLKKRYLLKSKRVDNQDVRIVPELRKKASFQRLNLMSESYPFPHDYDVVFCRNVLIYFERDVQEMVIRRLLSHLKPGGYFFLGHSESIMGLNLPLQQMKPTVYRKL